MTVEQRAARAIADKIVGSYGHWEPQEGEVVHLNVVVRGKGQPDVPVTSIHATPEIIAAAWALVDRDLHK